MIQVSVTSTEVRNQRGIAKASGKNYDINFQTVWFHTHDKQGGSPVSDDGCGLKPCAWMAA